MEFITYEVEGQVGIITINRPKALNALNSAVLDELDATIDGVDLDAVRCLILTGAGEKSFVAGADIAEMSTLTKEEGEAFGKKGNDIFRKIETLPIPVIAAVNGFALGGGCEISMSCDTVSVQTMQYSDSRRLALELHLDLVEHRDLQDLSDLVWQSR